MQGALDVDALSKTPVRAVLKMALPTMGAMLLQSLVNEIDILFFSKLPACDASTAQAALLPSLLTVWLFGGTLSAISVGTQTYTARRAAEKDFEGAGQVVMNALLFCVLGGLIMMGIATLSLHSILAAQKLRPDVLETAYAYSKWRVLGIVSMATTIGVKAFFDGIGKTHVHFVASLVMNIFNVTFCYMFIFGKFGAPAMGAAGAGVGAFASTWIGLFIVLLYASREQEKYRWFRLSNVNRSLIWDMVKLAAPAALATIVMMVGFGLFNSFSATLDGGKKFDGSCGAEEPLNGAATTNIVGIMKLIFTACLAFGAATATFVSQSLGAKRPDLASRFGWTSVRIGLVVFGVVGLVVGVLFPRQIISIMTHSEAVRAAMLMPLRMMGVATPIIAVALILSEALFGAGSTKFVAAAQLVLIFGILVPLSWFLSLKTPLGLTGMWMAAVAYSVCAASVMAKKFGGDSWKSIKL